MKAFGLFGATVPEEHGGLGLDVSTYARVIEELSRGWMSLAGMINSHLDRRAAHHQVRDRRAALPVAPPARLR